MVKIYQSFSKKPVVTKEQLINLNSANALLKLIEEPSDFDYFFLVNNIIKVF